MSRRIYIDGAFYEADAWADSDDEDDTGETGTHMVDGAEEET